MTIARGQMNRQLYQDGSGIRGLMEGKISDDEIMNIIEVLEDTDIVDDDVMSDEDREVMEMNTIRQSGPDYQYDEENLYTGPRDMRMGGGIMTIRPQYGFGSFVSSIAKGIGSLGKSVVKGIGDVAKNIDLEDALAVAAMFTPAAPYVGPTYAAAGGDNPFIQAATMFGQPGGGFGFPGQTPPTVPTGREFGIADALRMGNMVLKTDPSKTGTGNDTKKDDRYEGNLGAILKILDRLFGEGEGGKALAGTGAGAALAKLAYEDRKRLLEELEKARKEQRAGVERFREKFETTAGTGRGTGAPTSAADVVRRPANMGGIMDLDVRTNPQGVQEIDYREKGGFVPPIGIKEKADDIPAMLSNNEFVFTADAVRAAGGGSVNKGAQKMYALMKQLEGQA